MSSMPYIDSQALAALEDHIDKIEAPILEKLTRLGKQVSILEMSRGSEATRIVDLLSGLTGTDATRFTEDVVSAGAVLESDFDATTFLYATDDDTPQPKTPAEVKAILDLEIGTDVQAWDAQLDDIAALAVTDGNVIVGDGSNWVAESGATARTSLGLAIGTDVQAYDATLAALAAYNTNGLLAQIAADTFAGRTITGTANEITVTNGDGVSGNPTLSLPSGINLGDASSLATDEVKAYNGAGLKLYDDGSNGIFVKDGGNVGIGTTLPSYRLHIKSSAANTWPFYITASDGGALGGMVEGSSGDAIFNLYDTSGNADISLDTSGNSYFNNSGNVGIGDTSPTALLDINSDILRLRTAKTPASAGAAGNAGDICWDADFLYIATATNTWERVAIATW